MKIVRYSEACRNLKRIMDRVAEHRAPILITRQRGENVALIPTSE